MRLQQVSTTYATAPFAEPSIVKRPVLMATAVAFVS